MRARKLLLGLSPSRYSYRLVWTMLVVPGVVCDCIVLENDIFEHPPGNHLGRVLMGGAVYEDRGVPDELEFTEVQGEKILPERMFFAVREGDRVCVFNRISHANNVQKQQSIIVKEEDQDEYIAQIEDFVANGH